MDNVIHFKVDTTKYKTETIMKFYETTQKYLGDNYKIIITPFDVNKIDGDVKIITLDLKQYSYNELMEAIEKAWMYDELN